MDTEKERLAKQTREIKGTVLGGINKEKDFKAGEVPLCSEIHKTLVLLKRRVKGGGKESD